MAACRHYARAKWKCKGIREHSKLVRRFIPWHIRARFEHIKWEQINVCKHGNANANHQRNNFVRPEIKGMFYADRVETDWPFRVLLPVGTHVPFHCTASGKTYLASLPAAKRRNMLAGLDLHQYTETTHTSAATLEQELKQVARDGYALDREEFHEGMVAIAVPVLDSRRRYVAALATHGPKQRFNVEDAMTRRSLLVESAKIITETFGY